MNTSPFGYPQQPARTRGEAISVLPFLRRVYTLFTAGIATTIVAAMIALYAGTPVLTHHHGATFEAPPIASAAIEHPFLLVILFFVSFFGAMFARRVPGLGVAALFGFTFVTGIWLAPALFFVQMLASSGHTLDPSPIRDAFLLSGAAFTGLSGYALVTRKDFSFMAGFLSMGLWVVIGASILGIFVHSAAFSLAISSVVILLFGGFILYDTSNILRRGDDDAVGAALTLFLDVLNLFMALLNILSSQRDRS